MPTPRPSAEARNAPVGGIQAIEALAAGGERLIHPARAQSAGTKASKCVRPRLAALPDAELDTRCGPQRGGLCAFDRPSDSSPSSVTKDSRKSTSERCATYIPTK